MVGTSKERCREARFPDGVGRATIGPFTFFDRYHIQAQNWIRLIGPLRKKMLSFTRDGTIKTARTCRKCLIHQSLQDKEPPSKTWVGPWFQRPHACLSLL